MKKLFNMKLIDNSSIAKYMNNLNIMMSQLYSIDIKFDDEVRAFVLLSLLLDR